MASYLQWLRLATVEREVKQLTWICGTETVLVQEIADFIRSELGAPAYLDYMSFSPVDTPERDIWTAVNQHTPDPDPTRRYNRLIIVRDVNLIQNWQPLVDWANDKVPRTYLVLVDPSPDFDTKLSHLDAVKFKGRIIKCSPLKEEQPVAWVKHISDGRYTDHMAEYLLTRVRTLAAAKNVILKMQLWPDAPISEKLIDEFCSESAADDIVECLVLGQKKEALSALEGLDWKHVSFVIGQLESRLETLAWLHEPSKMKATQADVGRSRIPVPSFLVKRYLRLAERYDPRRVARCRSMLALVDDQIRSGAKTGTLESLVAIW